MKKFMLSLFFLAACSTADLDALKYGSFIDGCIHGKKKFAEDVFKIEVSVEGMMYIIQTCQIESQLTFKADNKPQPSKD